MTADRGRPELTLYALVGIGALNLGSLLIGLGIGWFLDDRLGAFPACTLAGLVVGIVSGLVASWSRIRKYFDDVT